MALDIDQTVNDFLRDAQYRIAEITIEMDDMDNRSNTGYKDLQKTRHELIAFMSDLWWAYDELKDGYNFMLAGTTDWTERNIILEIEYLRRKASLNEVPYLSFTNHTTELAEMPDQDNSSGTGFPIGSQGQYITYNVSGDPIAIDFPAHGGMKTYDDINTYFANRT